ncbi:MAG: glucose-1-phosphate thymidylyltransferase, partial [Rhodobacteraceae bacterium]|nr:glucose-1-phosphate thymidylyltransferase [Paracoccaceae bacterium]
LTTLMLAGIRDILIIVNPGDRAAFENLLGDGTSWGINIAYAEQQRPGGLPEAYILGADFIGGSSSMLILGDNIYFGQGFSHTLQHAVAHNDGMTAFGYHVTDPQNFGVVELDAQGRVVSLEEKPAKPKSSIAVTGMYICDAEAVAMAQTLKPSARGELEIVDILKSYAAKNKLKVERLGRGVAWLDTGSPHGLMQAAHFVETIETRQGFMIACPEEIAYRRGYIDQSHLVKLADGLGKTSYGAYLRQVAQEMLPPP